MTSANPDSTPEVPPRRRWLFAAAALAVVVLAGSATVYARWPRQDDCIIEILQLRPRHDRPDREPEWPVEDRDPDWDPVRVADWDHDRYWRFARKRTSIYFGARDSGLSEGVFKPWTEVDITRTSWRDEDPANKDRTREIATPTDQWHESADRAERIHCAIGPEWEMKRFIPGTFSYAQTGEISALKDAVRGPIEMGRLIGEEQQDGDSLRVFDLQPSTYAPRARTTLALDAADRIRRLEVKDSADGTVLLDLKVWPAPPDQAPIGDPSDQPIVSLP